VEYQEREEISWTCAGKRARTLRYRERICSVTCYEVWINNVSRVR